jgi:hypothetical protein
MTAFPTHLLGHVEHILRTSFPPGNPAAGGFARFLVEAMVRADPINLSRLCREFPVYGQALLLWDAGVIEHRRTPDGQIIGISLRRSGTHDEAIATALREGDDHARYDRLRVVLDPARTRSNGRQVTTDDLRTAREFGA